MGFQDHFSAHAVDYRAFRPTYPAALPNFLAAAAPARGLAWDVGCGNGQLSTALADRFARVVATDASADQIANAEPRPNLRYAVAPAEQSGLADGSCDLIVAAQAAHWFDLERFYAEVRRVAKPGAAVALVSYGLMLVDPILDPVIDRFHNGTLAPYWPADRWKVIRAYRDLPFPFAEQPVPPMAMQADWPLPRLLDYMTTWSGVKEASKALGAAPLDAFAADIAPLWGDGTRTIRWPLGLRFGFVV